MAVEPFCIVIIVRHLITYRLAPIVSDLKASVHDTICTLPQPKKSTALKSQFPDMSLHCVCGNALTFPIKRNCDI